MTPKDPGPAYCLNPDCGRPIDRSGGSGRPRHYCNDVCGRAYRRAREKHPTPDAVAHNLFADEVADDMARGAEHLRRLTRTRQPLAALSLLRIVERDLEDLKAALVQQARDQREKNAEIARSLSLPPEQLTRKLSSEAVRRRMVNRQQRPRNVPGRPAESEPAASAPVISIPRQRRPPARPGGATPFRAREPNQHPAGPAAVLARALSQLQRVSAKSFRRLAEDTHISASYVSRVLSGERCPSWKVTRALTLACGGDPAEIQPLWAAARGQTPSQRGSLHEALRGLHLSAARPATADLGARSGLSPRAVTGMLSGSTLPAWEDVEELAHALGAEAPPLRPLWNAARAAAAGPPEPPPADLLALRSLAEVLG
ncbi:helix-turn-helix domain-containing protein [Streptomyces sp. NPDC002573]|uniref:helix-turn-helix domain-containing protein n=1 Tax=Streptomyces sp. NPDC002573 TaxID=3364651 RepID=UPI00369A8E0E